MSLWLTTEVQIIDGDLQITAVLLFHKDEKVYAGTASAFFSKYTTSTLGIICTNPLLKDLIDSNQFPKIYFFTQFKPASQGVIAGLSSFLNRSSIVDKLEISKHDFPTREILFLIDRKISSINFEVDELTRVNITKHHKKQCFFIGSSSIFDELDISDATYVNPSANCNTLLMRRRISLMLDVFNCMKFTDSNLLFDDKNSIYEEDTEARNKLGLNESKEDKSKDVLPLTETKTITYNADSQKSIVLKNNLLKGNTIEIFAKPIQEILPFSVSASEKFIGKPFKTVLDYFHIPPVDEQKTRNILEKSKILLLGQQLRLTDCRHYIKPPTSDELEIYGTAVETVYNFFKIVIMCDLDNTEDNTYVFDKNAVPFSRNFLFEFKKNDMYYCVIRYKHTRLLGFGSHHIELKAKDTAAKCFYLIIKMNSLPCSKTR